MSSPDLIRPPFVLHQTVFYLVSKVADSAHQTAFKRHSFIANRLRAIRQDFAVLFAKHNHFKATEMTIKAFEMMVLYYVTVLNELREEPNHDEKTLLDHFSESLNILVQCYLFQYAFRRKMEGLGQPLPEDHPLAFQSPARWKFKSMDLVLHLFLNRAAYENRLVQFSRTSPRFYQIPEIQSALKVQTQLQSLQSSLYMNQILDKSFVWHSFYGFWEFQFRARLRIFSFASSIKHSIKADAPALVAKREMKLMGVETFAELVEIKDFLGEIAKNVMFKEGLRNSKNVFFKPHLVAICKDSTKLKKFESKWIQNKGKVFSVWGAMSNFLKPEEAIYTSSVKEVLSTGIDAAFGESLKLRGGFEQISIKGEGAELEAMVPQNENPKQNAPTTITGGTPLSAIATNLKDKGTAPSSSLFPNPKSKSPNQNSSGQTQTNKLKPSSKPFDSLLKLKPTSSLFPTPTNVETSESKKDKVKIPNLGTNPNIGLGKDLPGKTPSNIDISSKGLFQNPINLGNNDQTKETPSLGLKVGSNFGIGKSLFQTKSQKDPKQETGSRKNSTGKLQEVSIFDKINQNLKFKKALAVDDDNNSSRKMFGDKSNPLNFQSENSNPIKLGKRKIDPIQQDANDSEKKNDQKLDLDLKKTSRGLFGGNPTILNIPSSQNKDPLKINPNENEKPKQVKKTKVSGLSQGGLMRTSSLFPSKMNDVSKEKTVKPNKPLFSNIFSKPGFKNITSRDPLKGSMGLFASLNKPDTDQQVKDISDNLQKVPSKSGIFSGSKLGLFSLNKSKAGKIEEKTDPKSSKIQNMEKGMFGKEHLESKSLFQKLPANLGTGLFTQKGQTHLDISANLGKPSNPNSMQIYNASNQPNPNQNHLSLQLNQENNLNNISSNSLSLFNNPASKSQTHSGVINPGGTLGFQRIDSRVGRPNDSHLGSLGMASANMGVGQGMNVHQTQPHGNHQFPGLATGQGNQKAPASAPPQPVNPFISALPSNNDQA